MQGWSLALIASQYAGWPAQRVASRQYSMYMDVQVSRAAGDGETGTGREAGPGHAASELSLGHMCAAAALGRCVVNEREAAGR